MPEVAQASSAILINPPLNQFPEAFNQKQNKSNTMITLNSRLEVIIGKAMFVLRQVFCAGPKSGNSPEGMSEAKL